MIEKNPQWIYFGRLWMARGWLSVFAGDDVRAVRSTHLVLMADTSQLSALGDGWGSL